MQEHFRSSIPHHQDHVDPRHQGRLSRPAGHQWRLSAHMEGMQRIVVMNDCTSSQHEMKMDPIYVLMLVPGLTVNIH